MEVLDFMEECYAEKEHRRDFAASLEAIKSVHGCFEPTPEHGANPVADPGEGPPVPYYHMMFEDVTKYDTGAMPEFGGWGLRCHIWDLVPEYQRCEEAVYTHLEN